MERWQGIMLAFVEAKLTMDNMPTIDAAPVVHGRWERQKLVHPSYLFCSECGFPKRGRTWKFCPNCGAKMDLK